MTPQISPAAGCCTTKDHPEGGNNHAGGARLQQEPTKSASAPLGKMASFGSSSCRAGTCRGSQNLKKGEPVSEEFAPSKESLEKDTRLVMDNVLDFSRFGSGVTLRAYQKELAEKYLARFNLELFSLRSVQPLQGFPAGFNLDEWD